MKRRMIQVGKWDVQLGSALHAWSHFRVHRTEAGRHIVWGKLSLTIEDATAEVYPTCSQCGSFEIGEVRAGDEGWTVCQDCRSVEQGYVYVSKRQLEERGML